MRTKTESFTVRLGLSRAAPALRSQLCSDLQPFQCLPSHCGAECVKGLGTVSRQSDVMSTAFRHSCPLPSSSTAPPSAHARSCFPILPILGRDGTLHLALTVSVCWELPYEAAPDSCSTRATLAVYTTSEEQTFNMLNIYSRGQIRLPGHEHTIRVGRFKRQT